METTLKREKVKMELQNEKEVEETTANNRNKTIEEWGGNSPGERQGRRPIAMNGRGRRRLKKQKGPSFGLRFKMGRTSN